MRLLRGLRRSRDETHFHLVITGDTNEESGVSQVIYDISGPTEKHFATKYYGAGLLGIGIVLMCRNPELNFKRRIRLSKRDKTLYMDIMLDLEQMRQSAHEERKRTIAERLAEEAPAVVRKYSLPDFDEARFVEDFRAWLNSLTTQSWTTAE